MRLSVRLNVQDVNCRSELSCPCEAIHSLSQLYIHTLAPPAVQSPPSSICLSEPTATVEETVLKVCALVRSVHQRCVACVTLLVQEAWRGM